MVDKMMSVGRKLSVLMKQNRSQKQYHQGNADVQGDTQTLKG